MTIGTSIFLLSLGAILAFAVRTSPGWIDLNVVGYVLLLTGAVVLALTLTIWSKRRRGVKVTERQTFQDGQPTTETERRTFQDTSRAPPGTRDKPPDE